MKIKRLLLIDILKKVYPGISTANESENTNRFIFYKNKLLVITSGFQIMQILKSALSINGGVNAPLFFKTLNLHSSKKVNLIKKDEKLKLETVSEATSKISFNVEKINKKSIYNVLKEKIVWRELPKNFIEGINLCLVTGNSSLKQTSISLIRVNEKNLEATDSFKNSIFQLSKKMCSSPFLFSLEAAKILVNYDIKEFYLSKNWINFKTEDDTYLSFKLYKDVPFPDIQLFLDFKGKEIFLPEEILPIVNRCAIFCESKIKQTSIQVSINENNIEVVSENESGKIKERLSLKEGINKGINIRFEIMPQHLLYVLNTTKNFSFMYDKNKIKFINKDFQLLIPIISNK